MTPSHARLTAAILFASATFWVAAPAVAQTDPTLLLSPTECGPIDKSCNSGKKDDPFGADRAPERRNRNNAVDPGVPGDGPAGDMGAGANGAAGGKVILPKGGASGQSRGGGGAGGNDSGSDGGEGGGAGGGAGGGLGGGGGGVGGGAGGGASGGGGSGGNGGGSGGGKG